MRHGFDDLGLGRIVCGCFEGNVRSKKVQEKCGFSYMNTNEKAYIPMLDEERIEHFSVITREMYSTNLQNQR